jgi:outer membrane protein
MDSLSRRRLGALAAAVAISLAGARASIAGDGIDVFNTGADVSKGPTGSFGDPNDLCRQGPIPVPLALYDAIERALCDSPRTRASWAAVKAAAATLGVAKSAYLPTLTGAAQLGQERDRTTVTGPSDLSSNYRLGTNGEQLQIAWLLFDFDGRGATVRSGRQLLLAAEANQNLTLQSSLANVAKDFYTAQAANAKVLSAKRIETGARQNVDAASARYQLGVAPVTDELQAKTALAQAIYERAAAEGAYRTSLGALAVDMSLTPDTPLALPEMDQSLTPDANFVKSVRELMDQATDSHPSVLAAKAQYAAANANVAVARAQGRPKLSADATLSRSSGPLNSTVGTLEYPSVSRSTVYGLELQVPLFSGFQAEYQVRNAEALAAEQEQVLRDTRQQVQLGVWSGFQTLQTDTENVKNTAVVLESARAAFEASQQRYKSGVGNILELLSAQAILANAEQQHIQAELEWRAARLAFAASLGSLGLGAVK